jgi:signal transduction histidine kinase/HAMP domain-containing protein
VTLRGRRRPGLQVWLVAILIAVGALASLAVVLSIVPTFESSLRDARASATAHELYTELQSEMTVPLPSPDSRAQLNGLANQISSNVGAQVRIYDAASPTVSGWSIGCCKLLNALHAERNLHLAPNTWRVADGNRIVYASAGRAAQLEPSGLTDAVVIEAAAEVRGISGDQIATIQARLILAVAAVLTLAALAGYGLSLLVGRRISVLASTAASLARGDLHARAPSQRIREFAVLGDSLNRMAGRIEQQVDEITTERDRARVLISSLVEGVISINDRGAVTLINPAARRLLGLEHAHGIDQVADLPEPIGSAIRNATPLGADDVHETEIVLNDGTELQLAIAPVAEPGPGVVVTMRDITEQRQLERARRDLVANVSHELKTPLAAIKGLMEILQGGRVNPEQQVEFLSLMEVESDRLERLVEEQLQLARLDSGAMPLELEEFDLDALADGVVASRRPLAEVAGIDISARNDGVSTIVADPARVEQIVLILLDNAFRHTPPGGSVVVSARQTAVDAQIEVADTGDGIPADEQPFVFDRFYRGDPSREGRSAGLGLAIARGLAEAHGGRIELVSAPGIGSTFTVHLPTPALPGAGERGPGGAEDPDQPDVPS